VSEATGFTIAELIEHTANELRQAQVRRTEDGVMVFTKCELELSVTVKGEAGGGFRFWVVNASSKLAGETVSKIKLSFDAHPENIGVYQPPPDRD
jgi:hypothetical protein